MCYKLGIFLAVVKTLADRPVMSHSANTEELNNYLNYSILVIVNVLVIITKIIGRTTIIVLAITIITVNIYIALVLCGTISCTLQL